MNVAEVIQLQFIVTDESSAIQWLRQELSNKPQTFQEIHPKFMREIAGWSKHEKSLELSELLKQNFLCDEGTDRWYVPDPNKAGDLEKLRERALLREFEEYRASTQRKLKIFRLEAVRAGFKKAWQEKDYQTIIEVAKKIPEDVLQEDPKLLMWYDQAVTRMGGEAERG